MILLLNQPKGFSVNIEVVRRSFRNSVKAEIEYRPERKIESPEQVLQDIIDTSLIISGIVSLSKNEENQPLREINSGINQFKHYLFEGTFGLLQVKVASSKAALLASVILKDYMSDLPKFRQDVPLGEYRNRENDFVSGKEKTAIKITSFNMDIGESYNFNILILLESTYSI